MLIQVVLGPVMQEKNINTIDKNVLSKEWCIAKSSEYKQYLANFKCDVDSNIQSLTLLHNP